MKIIYANRYECMKKKGGDTYQMLYTKHYLEKYYPDIQITIVSSPSDVLELGNYDLIHIFNIQFFDEVKSYIDVAREKRIRVIISPIYWRKQDAIYLARLYRITNSFLLINLLRPIKRIINFKFDSFRYLSKKYKNMYQDLLNQAIAIIPNSNEELNIIKQEFNYSSHVKSYVVPNAIPSDQFSSIPIKLDKDFKKYKGCLLEVARIEPIKNQIGVLLACMGTQFPIVFIGNDPSPQSLYSQKVHDLANKRGNVFFIGEVTQKELIQYYNCAKAHILPSFRESPGLVSLEALFNGCTAIVSNSLYCPIDYYHFNNYAIVCDPYSIKSIKSAVNSAMNNIGKKVPREYFNYFSYNQVAKMLYKIYGDCTCK